MLSKNVQSFILLVAIISHAFSTSVFAEQHKELGKVEWLRNYEEAVEQSKVQNKPILILFQEVPGCEGCIQYGETTLSHPLIVEAIEREFIPIAIFNNSRGYDATILKQFKEPAWNFQVMRYLDSSGSDIIPRKDRIWTPTETAQRMVEALTEYGNTVPPYLQSIARSGQSTNMKTAAFSMGCFWDGEAKLGGIDGVFETEAGWIDGREVVKLRFDPEVVEWSSLVEKAQKIGCAYHVYAPDSQYLSELSKTRTKNIGLFDSRSYRTAKALDQKRHLRAAGISLSDLNSVQQTKINAAISRDDRREAVRWLSPAMKQADS